MFTGLIEGEGTVKVIEKGEKSSRLTIEASDILTGLKIGDSISTNGVCLTISNMNNSRFTADVMAETIRRSNLGNLKIGEKVNLERALRLQDRLGGHIVSGHIDGIGEILNLQKEDNAVWITIKADGDILRYIVEKGSIALDGVSLTVAYVDDKCFKVSIIPHTAKETILLKKIKGSMVNIECDVLSKYVEKLLNLDAEKKENKKMDLGFLKQNGFI
ncbi:riboflavin synthase alpha chain [Clostridium acidisoli DSM 12555]|uniref:Riboflavin synthase n=1 Tax=Clostridium acidisoli DSM 12555 TaxID=1121291 RepID=A0A1W1XV10_9CLOT|nr:riboflavin synthase [Clostridium acidisoli]SMC27727.1 riboflavin synthase alpha chain [Clostridium acidisoli DSM 12555]